ncbi:MAG: AtpZ/AtpI family protein [Isosphaeraceae bacterium]
MVKQHQSRSPLALGIEWASRVTTIGLMFALPALLGYGADRWLHTTPAGTIAGAGLGFVAGMVQTMRMSRELAGGSMSREKRSGDERGPKGPPRTPS